MKALIGLARVINASIKEVTKSLKPKRILWEVPLWSCMVTCSSVWFPMVYGPVWFIWSYLVKYGSLWSWMVKLIFRSENSFRLQGSPTKLVTKSLETTRSCKMTSYRLLLSGIVSYGPTWSSMGQHNPVWSFFAPDGPEKSWSVLYTYVWFCMILLDSLWSRLTYQDWQVISDTSRVTWQDQNINYD